MVSTSISIRLGSYTPVYNKILQNWSKEILTVFNHFSQWEEFDVIEILVNFQHESVYDKINDSEK